MQGVPQNVPMVNSKISAQLRRLGLILNGTKPFVTNTYIAISFAAEVPSELLKMDRSTSHNTFCVFAKFPLNSTSSNVSAHGCPHGMQKPCKRKEKLQNRGVIASVALLGREKGARLHRDHTIWDGHKTAHKTSRA